MRYLGGASEVNALPKRGKEMQKNTDGEEIRRREKGRHSGSVNDEVAVEMKLSCSVIVISTTCSHLGTTN